MSEQKTALAQILSILEFIILICVICLCILLIIPRFAGFQMYSVVSGSMEPEIPVGSMIYSKAIDPSELTEDDVVVFRNEGGAVISHRVVKNKVVSGEIVTKGDANDTEDPTPAMYDRVIGKEVFHLPKVGGVLAAVTTMPGKIAVACFIALAIVMHLIREALYKKTLRY